MRPYRPLPTASAALDHLLEVGDLWRAKFVHLLKLLLHLLVLHTGQGGFEVTRDGLASVGGDGVPGAAVVVLGVGEFVGEQIVFHGPELLY